MFTSKLIKAAWKIRREAAKTWTCGIMEISWKECIRMAKENDLGKFELKVIDRSTVGEFDKIKNIKNGTLGNYEVIITEDDTKKVTIYSIRAYTHIQAMSKVNDLVGGYTQYIINTVQLTLPTLIGSEKQITWAEQIRKEWIESLDEEIKDGDMDDFDMNDVTRLKAEILDTKVYAECGINNSCDLYLKFEKSWKIEVLVGKNEWKEIV